MTSWGHQNMLSLSRPLAFISYKVFLISKKRSRTSLAASSSLWLLILKYFSCYIRLTDQISLTDHLYLERYGAMFPIKTFFLHEQILKTNLNILRTERAFKMKGKAISINFQGLSLKQIKQFYCRVRVRL